MQKIINGQSVKWSQESKSGRNGRVAEISKLKRNALGKSLGQPSCQVTGPRLFNCGPKDIRNLSNCELKDFKYKFDQFLTKEPDERKGEGLIPGATNHWEANQLAYPPGGKKRVGNVQWVLNENSIKWILVGARLYGA